LCEPPGVLEPAPRSRDAGLRVGRLDEVKAFGGCIETQLGTIASFQRPPNVLWLPLTTPDKRQATDHRPHLVVKEAAGGRLDVNFLADPPYVEPVKRLHRAVGLAMH